MEASQPDMPGDAEGAAFLQSLGEADITVELTFQELIAAMGDMYRRNQRITEQYGLNPHPVTQRSIATRAEAIRKMAEAMDAKSHEIWERVREQL